MYKSLIESSGSEFIEFADSDDGSQKSDEKQNPADTFEVIIRTAYKIVPQLLQLCEERKPAAIAYDMMTFHVKFFYEYVNINKDHLMFPIPKQVFINPR